MARMIPEDYQDAPEAPREAERLLYREFKAQLPDEFHVFHRRPWHAPNAGGAARDGEAAFVIAHERRGILVLDALAGGVARDAGSDRWHAVDYGGRRIHEIDDPVERVRRCGQALLRRLGDLPAGGGRGWSVGHALALPDVDVLGDLPGLPAAAVLDRRGVDRLAAWTDAAMRYGSDRERHAAPGRDGMGLLCALLGVGFEIRPLIGHLIPRHERELARLTVEQYRVLDGLSRFRRALICGCAGSGKTLLALEKARRLAEQGYRTLYACYNTRHGEYCRAFLKEWPRVTVSHFHGLCRDWARKASVAVRGPQEDARIAPRDFFDRVLPDALAAAARRLPGERYDAILVDEAQDFKPPYWEAMLELLREPRKSVLAIFYDDNQKLYAGDLKFPVVDTQYDLTENCRNVRRVHDLSMRFYQADRRIVCRSPAGPRPEVMIYRTPEELIERVGSTLERFVREERIPPEQIAVLTGHGKEKSHVWRTRRFGGFTLAPAPPLKPGEILWSSVHGFKGLERPAVILAEIEPLSHAELDTVLYIGCSRARVHLAVIASEAAAHLGALAAARR